MERTCRNCVFFEKEEVMGACRRFPPVPRYGFSTVGELSWCGEWRMIEEIPVPVKEREKPKPG